MELLSMVKKNTICNTYILSQEKNIVDATSPGKSILDIR